MARTRSRSRSRRRQPHIGWQPGMELGRYVVQKLLGDGTFGRVLACRNESGATVAVKVIKGLKRFSEHAEAEAEVLVDIQRMDPKRQSRCVQLCDMFTHNERHVCLVFEALDTSLRDFLKANQSRGLFLADVRQISRQLFECLSFLHNAGLLHTDLKCRNVMLRDGRFDVLPHPRHGESHRLRNCDIVVIDFGGAVYADEGGGCVVGTRQFRAPEVLLRLEWDEAVDMWSAGCIIVMLYLGQKPFSVHENMEHLAMMQRFLGRVFPRQMLTGASVPSDVVVEDGQLAWPRCADEKAVARVEQLIPLAEVVCPHHSVFLDLCLGLLKLSPWHRLNAQSALAHSFLVDDLPE